MTARLPTTLPLRRAPSRTRTARRHLDGVAIALVDGAVDFSTLYAGPAVLPATAANIPGRLAYRAGEAIQVHARGGADASLVVVLDLGDNCDVARLELYGNLLLPPYEVEARPAVNFGLPRSLGVAVLEPLSAETDLHALPVPTQWMAGPGIGWRSCFFDQDLRAAWGWTAIHLPPTFGRYLAIGMWDFPQIEVAPGQHPHAVAIERLVVYPFLEDVDHRPSVEFVPVAARQTAFTQPSAYWSAQGVAAPDPVRHQSVARGAAGRCYHPAQLVGVTHQIASTADVPAYVSEPLGPGERLHLVLQTTTDETAVISGVTLAFSSDAAEWPLCDYQIDLWVTDDREAAWSPDPSHPSWRRAALGQVVRASIANPQLALPLLFPLLFPTPLATRFLRLTVSTLPTAGVDPAQARLVLRGLTVHRARDFCLEPALDEEMRVTSVVMRLRGAQLFDDYAFVDGQNSLSLTVEAQRSGEPFRELASFRTLADLLENTQSRAYSNSRSADKPIQIYQETMDSNHGSSQTAEVDSEGKGTTVVDQKYPNFQITRSGSVTTHTETPWAGIDPSEPFPSVLPPGQGIDPSTNQPVALESVLTERWYPTTIPTLDTLPQLTVPTLTTDLDADARAVGAKIDEFARWADGLGRPVSFSLGASVGGGPSGGIPLGVAQFNINGAISASASMQLGGGKTRALVTGPQGATVANEVHTVDGRQSTLNKSHQSSITTVAGTSNEVRKTTRVDESIPVRKTGIAVQYAGAGCDLLLMALPVDVRLRGPQPPQAIAGQASVPPAAQMPLAPRGDVLRVRVDHLPEGLTLDVEFRGSLAAQRSE